MLYATNTSIKKKLFVAKNNKLAIYRFILYMLNLYLVNSKIKILNNFSKENKCNYLFCCARYILSLYIVDKTTIITISIKKLEI